MSSEITPSLESITIRAKYKVPMTDFVDVVKYLENTLKDEEWIATHRIGDSIEITYVPFENARAIEKESETKVKELWAKIRDKRRTGMPLTLSLIVIEHQEGGILLDVECRPALWYRITQTARASCSENDVQEALLECSLFVKSVMSGLKGKAIEPVSVYPIIQRTEIKSRLLNLGLNDTVDHMNKAERHIVQNNFEESLKSLRTAFEKMIDWELKKRGLDKTDNYKNDLERLKSKGFIDSITTELIQTYYRCLSNIAVHAKGEVPPGFHEAQMGYGITLIMLQYFADKLP
jgi:hypothetical protein